ncbi:MAG: hypothetical protein E6Q67_12500 [Roseateles sp.]|nr:MAG: hypothetical protein E6Q67_12500 [Roseateles sp.]
MVARRERRRKKIIYKRVQFQGADGHVLDFEALLRKALRKLRTVGDRREPLAPETESPVWRLIAQYKPESGFVNGVLARYTPGTNPMFLEDDASAESLNMRQVSAGTTSSGKRRELVEGMLFFTVVGNHMAMMQTQILKAKQLEEHLTWLLKTADQIPATFDVVLSDHVPPAAVAKLKKAPVKSVDLGAPLLPSTDTSPSIGSSKKGSRDFELADGDAGTGILSVIKGWMRPDTAAALNLDALGESNFRFSLHVTYDYKTTSAGQKLMNNLATALRGSEDVEALVTLKDGTKLQGDELRLCGNINVDVYDGVPQAEEVFGLMKKWLTDKVMNGSTGQD